MVEVVRQLRVEFSKDEIQGILAERAKALVLDSKEIACVELEQTLDVEGSATVVLIVGNKPVDVPERDKLLNARKALLDEVKSLTDQIDGRKPVDREIPKLQARKKASRKRRA